jgi:hypothetical protein
MFLVLCSANDVAAIWVYLQLKKTLGDEIDLVTAEMLAHALRWEHRITRDGISTKITLADGRLISSDDISATLNRLDDIPASFSRAAEADREYAAAELRAFFASWLHALPGPSWNRATPSGLSGSTWRQQAEWNLLASRAGFATTSLRKLDPALAQTQAGPARALLVVGETVLGDSSLAAPARLLSRQSDAPILGIALHADGSFHSATPRPDLRSGGAAAIDALRTQLFTEVRP